MIWVLAWAAVSVGFTLYWRLTAKYRGEKTPVHVAANFVTMLLLPLWIVPFVAGAVAIYFLTPDENGPFKPANDRKRVTAELRDPAILKHWLS